MQLSSMHDFLSNLSTWAAESQEELAWAISRQEELDKVEKQFPFSTVVEGAYPEFDIAERWCWQRFGPRHGECNWQSEYPGCPVILAAEKTLKTFVVQGGPQYQYMAYSNPTKHSHTGTWTTFWLDKTDYDYGFGMFCFSSEDDKIRFINHVPEVEPEIQTIWASQ